MRASRFEHWTLIDHLAFLFRFWPLLLAGTLAAGLGAYFLSPRSGNRAEGFVRVGFVYGIGLVEPATDIEARASSTPFLASLLKSDPQHFSAPLDAYSLRVTAPKTFGLMSVVATAPDTESAALLVRATADRLAAEHSPKIKALERLTQGRLQEIRSDIAEMRQLLIQAPGKEADFHWQATLLERVAELEREGAEFDLRADPNLSIPTALTDEPVRHPSRLAAKLAFVGAALGFGLMVLFVYTRTLFRTALASQQSAPARAAVAEAPAPEAEDNAPARRSAYSPHGP